MRLEVRIVAGSLRGRKVAFVENPQMRPTPQMVREALFSILGHAVPGRPFFDLFAGTGVIGIEAISRGAKLATFVERDFRLGDEIARHLKAFGVEASGRVQRSDVYRWADHWRPPSEPVNLYVSPPFSDYERNLEGLQRLVVGLQAKVAPDSVLIVQSETGAGSIIPDGQEWDERRYGRNELLIWVKEEGVLSTSEEKSAEC